jgi:hypothetical protein
MADYYPLIARAVASLGPDSTPELRAEMYERATHALIGQLRSLDPPMDGEDIERERMALEAAVRRVEQEVSAPSPAPPPPRTEAPPPPRREAQAPPPPPPPPARPASSKTGAAPVAARAAFRESEDQDDKSFEDGYETEEPGVGDDGSGPEGFEDLIAAEPPQPRHPQAPRPEVEDRSWVRGAVVLGGIAVVVAFTAYAAWRLRDKASTYQRTADVTEQQQKYTDRIGENGPEAGPATAPPATTTAPDETSAGSSVPAVPAAQAPTLVPAAPPPPGGIGVFQRAGLIEEPSEPNGQPKATSGKVTWKLETVPGGEGGLVDNAVHATVELAEAGLTADLMLRKNRDQALPASHTLEVRFTTTDKSTNGKIRDMSVPEMRTEEGQRGSPLSGLPVPVMENLVLVGLSSLPADVERNLDLLKSRNWMMVGLRYANGKRAVLVFEKGSPGDRVLQDALQAWKQ